MSIKGGPATVTSGLILELDAANPKSYTSGSSTWYDTSGNKNNFTTGSIAAFPLYSSASNGIFNFTAVNYFTASSNIINNLSQMTISVWVYSSTSNYAASWIANDNLAANRSWYFGNNDGISYKFALWTGGGNRTDIQASYALNTWYNLIAWYDGSNVKLFTNGVQSGTLPKTGTIDFYNFPITIGSISNQYLFSGSVAHISIYNRALTNSEILTNYTATKGRFGLT